MFDWLKKLFEPSMEREESLEREPEEWMKLVKVGDQIRYTEITIHNFMGTSFMTNGKIYTVKETNGRSMVLVDLDNGGDRWASLGWFERVDALKVGDRVRYTGENVKNAGENVKKGSVYTVTQVAENGVVVRINAYPFTIPPDKFERA